jgi:hypothetical protein
MQYHTCVAVACGFLLFADADQAAAGQLKSNTESTSLRGSASSQGSQDHKILKTSGYSLEVEKIERSSAQHSRKTLKLDKPQPSKLQPSKPLPLAQKGLAAANLADLGLKLDSERANRNGLESLALKPWAPSRGVGVKVELTW